MKRYEEEKKMPNVSIIIPIYNTKPYLKECLDSVLQQTLQDMEVICVNDGSTDGSETIVEEIAKQDCRVKLISRENGGLAAARNTGLKYAAGEYCYFLDSDDTIKPLAMEKLYQQAKEDHLDILFFGGSCFYQEQTKDVLQVYQKEKSIWERKRRTDVLKGEELFSDFQLNRIFVSSVSLQLIRRQFLFDHSITFAEGFIHEDLIFTFEATLKAKRVKCVQDCLFGRRLRAESIVTSKLTHRNFEGRFHNFIQSISISRQHGGNKKSVTEAMADFIKMSYNNTLYVYRNLDKEERNQIFATSDDIYAVVYKIMAYDMRS